MQAMKKITGSGENRNDNLTTAQQHQSMFQWVNKIIQVTDVKYNETPEKLKTWGFTVSEYTVLTNKDYLAGSWQPVKNNTTGTLFKFQQGPMSQFNGSLFGWERNHGLLQWQDNKPSCFSSNNSLSIRPCHSLDSVITFLTGVTPLASCLAFCNQVVSHLTTGESFLHLKSDHANVLVKCELSKICRLSPVSSNTLL